MARRVAWIAVLGILPLMLAGCSALSSSDNAAPGDTTVASAAIATRIAIGVAATVASQSHPLRAAGASPPASVRQATVAGTVLSPTRLAPVATGTLPPPTNTPRPTDTPTPVATPVLLAPIHLAEREIGGGKLLPHYWTNTSAIVFTIAAPVGVTLGLRPQVEIQPVSKPFTGMPTAEGQTLPSTQVGEITVQTSTLPEGAYHWQARLTDGAHRGPWADYYQGPAFRLDRTPPGTVVISSTTYPDQAQTYNRVIGHFTWTVAADNGALQGYQTGIDRKANGLPDGAITSVRTEDLGPLANGDIYFHVRAVDWAGNHGPIATYHIKVDSTAPLVAHAFFNRFQFNPQFDMLGMHFTPNKAVSVRIEMRRQSTKGVVRILDLGQAPAGKTFDVAWDGRNYRGILVQPGLYTMTVKVTDGLGNVGASVYTDLAVNYRRIVVHLATQTMNIFDRDALVRTTFVTTGNALLPTPTGIWHIGGKFHPYKFISPWKKGSPYYYSPATVQYALYFHAGGYFIHDAPWRTVYGPGTNTAPGPPGIYSGTHGCINVPGDVAKWLFTWAPVGTVVVVQS